MGGFTITQEQNNSSLHDVSSNQSHRLGTRWATPDGRVFRYAKSGGALTIGRAVGVIAKTSELRSDLVETGLQARTTAQWDGGTRTIITNTTATATTTLHAYPNRFNDGYVWVNDLAGEGQILQIKTHGVSASSGSTSLTLNIYEDELLTIAITTASQMGLVENLYSDVIVHPGITGSGIVLGVAPRGVASGKYFWLQTWGPCPVMAGPSTMVVGEQAIAGCTTGSTTALAMVPGSAYPANTTMQFVESTATTGSTGYTVNMFMQPELGFVLVAATGDAEYALVYLTIAP